MDKKITAEKDQYRPSWIWNEDGQNGLGAVYQDEHGDIEMITRESTI